MAVVSDILIIKFSENSDLEQLSWVNALSVNLKSSVGQLLKKQPEIKVVSLSESSTIEIISRYKIILFVLDKAISLGYQYFNQNILSQISADQMACVLLPAPIKFDNYPKTFRQLPFYIFFDAHPVTGKTRIYDSQQKGEPSRLYWLKVLDLSYNINLLLNNNKAFENTNISIYLAETTPDQNEYRDGLRSELIQRGYKVYPQHPLSGDVEEIRLTITEYIEKSDISVHIIGKNYGEIMNQSSLSIGDLQCRIAMQHDKKINSKSNGFIRLFWFPSAIKQTDTRQSRFIECLKNEEINNQNVKVLSTLFEDFKVIVLNKLVEIEKGQIKDKDEVDKPLVYLIFEQKKADNLNEVTKFLEKNNCISVVVDYSMPINQLMAMHYENLKKSDAIIICDFDSPQLWISNMYKDVLKAPGYGRIKPFQAKGILTKKREQILKDTIDFDNILIDSNGRFEQSFLPFLQKLNQK